jgi:hypothetical protein
MLLLTSSLILQNVDASQLYHSIRGQAIIKLYVIFNALEICDKLCSAFGHDILDSLFATIDSNASSASKRFNRLARFVVATAYITAHTLVLFYQVTSLNVAINSYNNALLTLLISNQFVEIKGSVFKKFEKGNLFQLSCADIVERFQLSIFLVIVTLRNCLEIFGSGAIGDISNYIMYYGLSIWEGLLFLITLDWKQYIYHPSSIISSFSKFSASLQLSNEFKLVQIILGPAFIVFGTEIIVDWIKHAFIVKFNGLTPDVYAQFQESLCRDLLGVNTKITSPGKANIDRTPLVAKRIGFVSIPLACLVIRVASQIVQIIGVISDPGVNPLTPRVKETSPEYEIIGSWKLPHKLTVWIKGQRLIFEKAGVSGRFFAVSQRYSWVAPLFLW